VHERGVRALPHPGGQPENDRQTRHTARDQPPAAGVRPGDRSETRLPPHRPRTARTHRRTHTPHEGTTPPRPASRPDPGPPRAFRPHTRPTDGPNPPVSVRSTAPSPKTPQCPAPPAGTGQRLPDAAHTPPGGRPSKPGRTPDSRPNRCPRATAQAAPGPTRGAGASGTPAPAPRRFSQLIECRTAGRCTHQANRL
jgi:hypothetical protein